MKTTIKPILVTLLLLSSTLIFAQNPGDPPVDPGVSPINDYIIPMILVALVFGYKVVLKKKRISKEIQ
jgi:hypothetical protein